MELVTLIAMCATGVPATTLAAIVAHESGGNQYAINLNSRTHRLSHTPRTAQEAIATLKLLEKRQLGTYDIGLAQINSIHLRRFELNSADLLDPCTNLRASAQVLGECYERTEGRTKNKQLRLAHALSCYNTGSMTRGFRNGYVSAVYRHATTPPNLDIPTTLDAFKPVVGPLGPATTLNGESIQ